MVLFKRDFIFSPNVSHYNIRISRLNVRIQNIFSCVIGMYDYFYVARKKLRTYILLTIHLIY